MRLALFCHSLLSDWNHGNAHFLRGVVSELVSRGHHVRVFEPRDAWSAENLVRDHGEQALELAASAYPLVRPRRYERTTFDLDEALDGVDLAIVHEWNEPPLVRRIGEHRKRSRQRYRLLFHDTHHRSVTDSRSMAAYDLSAFDGVLAFGQAVRDVYEARGWAKRVVVWHEAADVRVFRPRRELGDTEGFEGDLVWIGNWGDDERTAELGEFLLEPVRALGLRARVHGVRYPAEARAALADHGLDYAGWLPNFRVPDVFARHRVTVHVPRRPYARALPGIPTIRVFEALACGIPMVSAPWDDIEGLFRPDRDYLVARSGADMFAHLDMLLRDASARVEIARSGLETIRARHTCAHRVDELLTFAHTLGLETDSTDEARVGPLAGAEAATSRGGPSTAPRGHARGHAPDGDDFR